MSTLKMKVVGYDEQSNSVLVAFASSATQSQNPDDYQPVAVQVSASDSIDKIKRDLANIGLQMTQAQANKEQMANNPGKVDEIKALVGQEFSFAEADLHAGGQYNNEVNL